MKKAVSVILAAALILAMPCAGADLDYSSMSDSELQAVVDSARTELFQRKQREENGNLIICDTEGVQVVFTGDVRLSSSGLLRMGVTVSNSSQMEASISIEGAYVNSWKVYASIDAGIVDPNKNARGDMIFHLSDAGLENATLEDIEDITFSYYLYDHSINKTVWRSPEMQLFIDGENVISVQEIYDIG